MRSPRAPGLPLRSLVAPLAGAALLLVGCDDGGVAWVLQPGPEQAVINLPRELPGGGLIAGGMLSDENIAGGQAPGLDSPRFPAASGAVAVDRQRV